MWRLWGVEYQKTPPLKNQTRLKITLTLLYFMMEMLKTSLTPNSFFFPPQHSAVWFVTWDQRKTDELSPIPHKQYWCITMYHEYTHNPDVLRIPGSQATFIGYYMYWGVGKIERLQWFKILVCIWYTIALNINILIIWTKFVVFL